MGTHGIRQRSPILDGFSGTGTMPGRYLCLTGTYHGYPGVPIPVSFLISAIPWLHAVTLELRPAVHALCGHRDFLRFLLSISQWRILEQLEEALRVSVIPIPSLLSLSQADRNAKSMLIDFFCSFLLKRQRWSLRW